MGSRGRGRRSPWRSTRARPRDNPGGPVRRRRPARLVPRWPVPPLTTPGELGTPACDDVDRHGERAGSRPASPPAEVRRRLSWAGRWRPGWNDAGPAVWMTRRPRYPQPCPSPAQGFHSAVSRIAAQGGLSGRPARFGDRPGSRRARGAPPEARGPAHPGAVFAGHGRQPHDPSSEARVTTGWRRRSGRLASERRQP